MARAFSGGDGTLLAVVHRGAILATAAMLIRNSFLLAILTWPALVSSLIPMAMMISGSVVFVWRSLKDRLAEAQAPKLNLEQPFSLIFTFYTHSRAEMCYSLLALRR